MPEFSTSFLFDGQRLHRNCRIHLAETGSVSAWSPNQPLCLGNKHLEGILSPPFVNAHCHLELSHLKGKIPPRTGMAGFIQQIQALRHESTEAPRTQAIEKALDQLYRSGVQAIGDICNGTTTKAAKAARPDMHFRNFCEVFSLDPSRADEAFHEGLQRAQELRPRSQVTLHAPYSISPRLRDLVAGQLKRQDRVLSLHFLESTEERQLFEDMEGLLFDLFRAWGLPLPIYPYDSVMDYVFERLPNDQPLLLVHGTELRQEEIAQIFTDRPRTWLALCPLANEYIHGTQPPANLLAAYPDRICIGTDSLAGNHTLDLVAEMRHLQQQNLPTEILLKWATANGARALGIDPKLFSISEEGHPKPVFITSVHPENAKLTSNSQSFWLLDYLKTLPQ